MVWDGMAVEKLILRSTKTQKKGWKDVHQSANSGYLQVVEIRGIENFPYVCLHFSFLTTNMYDLNNF